MPFTTIKRKNEIDVRRLMFLSVTVKYYICGEIREGGSWPQVYYPPRIRVNIYTFWWQPYLCPPEHTWQFHPFIFTLIFLLTVTHQWIPPLLENSLVWHVPLNIIRSRIFGVSLHMILQLFHFLGSRVGPKVKVIGSRAGVAEWYTALYSPHRWSWVRAPNLHQCL